ncbi:MAG: mu-protocadherin- cell-suface protein, partial [Planctomycetota bacterium]
ANWFTWQTPATPIAQPVYYDYGQGGNVTYEDNRVYINGSEVATAEEYAQSAAELATVAPPESEAEAKEAEWMPLGTFALATSEKDVSPHRVVQLAVNRDGIVSGTVHNDLTDQATSLQGQVDKETQRVAIRIGESDQVVAETGIYNLTMDEVPLLVHFGGESTENYLLVRMEKPSDSEEEDPQQP